MIAILGSMGAGLMVGTGTALSRGTGLCFHALADPDICTGGPLGMLLGYIFVGVSKWFFMI
jgi:amino acid permease